MSLKIRGRSLRRTDIKLTLWYILIFLVSSLIICGFLYLRLKHQLIKEVDLLLLDETKELKDFMVRYPNDLKGLKIFEEIEKSKAYYPLYFQIQDLDGEILFISDNFKGARSHGIDNVVVKVKENRVFWEDIYFPDRRRPFRFVASLFHPPAGSPVVIQMGTSLRFVRKSLSNFKSNLLMAIPIMVLLGSLGGWILARRSLSPIGYVVSKTQNITSQNLSERLEPRGTGDEMDDLIQTINGMIARLEGSFKRMAEFTADVSHELKTPLCAMRGEAEVLLSKTRNIEEYQEGLVHFIEQFDHLNRMINDLILLSKSDASQIELKMEPVRLDLLIKEVSGLFQILAGQKGLEWTTETPEEVRVMGDKGLLQQLVTNLMDNAIKYTPKGSIRVSLRKSQEKVFIKIQDTGVGIPREEQGNIFRRFYRVDKSRSRETGGVGLGLNIAEWIVHAHQGRIEVESELNRGSTFTVSLPILKI